ncbi:MAG: TetR/AcrR family transcriptional regulator [Deltaproteobacteria bacterium]|nr:MAG: TetR/AcrR family transcriptional regulator [Deltaproteobacteria bacterium]
MTDRTQRIVDTAVELAEKGGFEAVRLRDVASHAGVALGTLYRRFRSKEDLLIAALEQECAQLEQRVRARPLRGGTPLERVSGFFTVATRALCRRPNLARAVLRAVASGDPELTERVAGFHDLMTRLITAALRGTAGTEPAPTSNRLPSERERTLAYLLQHVWFASLVGWAGGLHGQSAVVELVQTAAEWLLRDPHDARAPSARTAQDDGPALG